MSKFKLKDGQNSWYAFACGYVQNFTLSEDRVNLYKEYCVYHVQAFISGEEKVWNTFDNLSEARRNFNQLKRRIRYGTPS